METSPDADDRDRDRNPTPEEAEAAVQQLVAIASVLALSWSSSSGRVAQLLMFAAGSIASDNFNMQTDDEGRRAIAAHAEALCRIPREMLELNCPGVAKFFTQ